MEKEFANLRTLFSSLTVFNLFRARVEHKVFLNYSRLSTLVKDTNSRNSPGVSLYRQNLEYQVCQQCHYRSIPF